ncbi:MAG: hypothetical protein WCI05_16565 [Myxococcales bacterium]
MNHQLDAWVRSRAWLATWSLVGLVFRLVLVFRGKGALQYFDEHDYHEIAQNLLAGVGFVVRGQHTAFRPPGQPFFLAAVYACAGPRPLVAEVILALALVPMAWLIARLARRFSSEPSARIAGAIAAVHPGLAFSSATLYPAALTALACTVGVVLFVEALDSGSRVRAAAAGAFLGVAGMATTYFVPFPLVAGLVAGARRKVAVAVLVAGVGLAPTGAWLLRNAVVLGTPVLASNGGFNLALGANDRATARSGNWIDPDPIARGLDTELERDRAYRDLAIAWIREHPGRFFGLAVGRSLASLESTALPKTSTGVLRLPGLLAGAVLGAWVLLGVVGLGLVRRRPEAWMVGAALGLVVASSAMTISKPRFRFPVDPLLGAFAAHAIERGVTARRRRQHDP